MVIFCGLFAKRLPFAVDTKLKGEIKMVEKVYPMTLEGKEKIRAGIRRIKDSQTWRNH